MWEVYRSNCRMAVDTCDWSLVSFKHLTDSSFAVLEYITKVNLSGNHTSTDRESTEMQFKYSHKKIFCCFVWPLPCCKRLYHNGSQKIRLEYGPWLQHVFPANLKYHDTPQEEETNSAGTSPHIWLHCSPSNSYNFHSYKEQNPVLRNEHETPTDLTEVASTLGTQGTDTNP